ncbi:hypothetical protein [Citrobacter sp. JGM124]|uniref:hypothetical protein n=1 Tax=Citrobacter sp. JGM124 TaxID=2799789 RepID=UPI001BA7408F|nr:hypothetical protein [Citrobacter sp. JGM124]MBS0847541.1 hypothetical protein [Citrobacter sp. JGM124]
MKKIIIGFIICGFLGSVSGCDDSAKENTAAPQHHQTDKNQSTITSTDNDAAPTLTQIKKYIFNNTKELGAVDSITITQIDDNDISGTERNRADVLNYQLKEYIIRGKYHFTDDIYEKKKHDILLNNNRYTLWTQPVKANQSLTFSLKASMKKKDQHEWMPDFSDFVSSPELPQHIYTKISQPERAILYGSDDFNQIKTEALAALNSRNAQCDIVVEKIKALNERIGEMTNKGERNKHFFALKNERSDLIYSYQCLKAYQSSCDVHKKTPMPERVLSQYVGFLEDAGEKITDSCAGTPELAK